MMKWRKEELRWWPLAPRLPFLFHSLIRSLCFFSHSSHWLFVSSVDLTTGRDLGDLSRGQLAAMTTEGSVWGLGSSLGQHQWCVQDPEATEMVSSKSRSCVSAREIILVSHISDSDLFLLTCKFKCAMHEKAVFMNNIRIVYISNIQTACKELT